MSELTPRQMAGRFDEVRNQMNPTLARFLDIAKTRIAATAREDHMQETGFTRPPFPPRRSRSGPLRMLTGRLERSLRSSMYGGVQENVSHIEQKDGVVKLTFGTRVPYAAVHEYGFIGQVQIPAHQRTIVQAFGHPLKSPKTVKVDAHKRLMTIPARPYLGPALDDNVEWIKGQLTGDISDMIVRVIK